MGLGRRDPATVDVVVLVVRPFCLVVLGCTILFRFVKSLIFHRVVEVGKFNPPPPTFL